MGRVAAVLLCVGVLAVPSMLQARTWNVPVDCPTIKAGIDSASSGDTVLVACGTYYENLSFYRKSGICLRSATGEPDCVTIDNQQQMDNAVYLRRVGESLRIEGLTITGGNWMFGAGVSCDDSTYATIVNCVITGNVGNIPGQLHQGGGISVYNASPTFIDCVVSDNSADLGGGVHCFGTSSPTFTDCDFSGNSATDDGGAAYFDFDSDATFSNCTFSNNHADGDSGRGGGVYCLSTTSSFAGCDFTGNYASSDGRGGGFYGHNGSYTFGQCTFTGNTVSTTKVTLGSGGGLYVSSSGCDLTTCTFSSNTAQYGGGAYLDGASGQITDCTFTQNTAVDFGGGLECNGSSPTLTNCTFTRNSAWLGGGMSIGSCNPVLTGCTFSRNSATDGLSRGGAIACLYFGDADLTECKFFRNSAEAKGGAIDATQECDLTITSCTFAANSAPEGGGLYFDDDSPPTIEKTIISGCPLGEAIACGTTSDPTLSCCNIYDNAGGNYVGCISGDSGTSGNFSDDPDLCDPLAGNFGVGPSSPCLPAGNTCGVLIGAVGQNCTSGEVAAVERTSWSSVKARYR